MSDRLAVGSSVEKGWEIIKMLREATKQWPPPNKFVLILPEPDKVEVWSWSPQRKSELSFLRGIISDFVSGK